MSRLTEIRSRLAELQPEIAQLAEIEEISDEDNTRLESDLVEFAALQVEEAPLVERAARVAAVSATTVTREEGDGAAAATQTRDSFQTIVRPAADDVFDLRSLNGMSDRQVPGELRTRAMQAVDMARIPDAHRESVEAIISSDDRDGTKARYIIEHGSPEYLEGFREYLANPAGGPTQGRSDRASLSLTGANGGYLVPTFLDPTIILTNNGVTNPFRSIATVKTITTNQWNGITSAGVTAEWIAEATEVADASPTFAQAGIPVFKADAYVTGSMEVIADSGVSGEISMLIADAKDRLEASAFAVGNGTTQPQGIVTALTLVTASRVAGSSGAAGAADFVLADVYALSNALPPRYRPNSSWLSEQSTYNRIRRFGEGSVGGATFWTDLNVGTPPLLLGRPTYESSEMDTTIVSGSNDDVLVLGDFRHSYYIIDRMGLELTYNPLVLGSNRRPSGEVGWVAFWRVGAEVVDANGLRMLRV